MISNYLKIAIRNLIRNKWNSFFNILGLSIAIACCVYIFFLLNFEFTYDGYHKDIDRLFRLVQFNKSVSRETNFACVPIKNGYYVKTNFDEVENLARIRPNRPTIVKYKDVEFIERFYHVENDIFKIFSIPFIKGESAHALERPYTAVLTQTIAAKYFGAENPIGQLLKIDTAFYEVTGVMSDYPWNTRVKIDIMLSWVTDDPDADDPTSYRHGGYVQTFIKLKENVNPKQFEERISNVPHIVDSEELELQGANNRIWMQPLKSIHFDNSVEFTWDTEKPANKTFIYILFATGIFILAIASLNFINLSTAKYVTRIKEVAIRKTVGSSRSQLIVQFIGESVLIVSISHIIGMFLVELFLPLLNQITQVNFGIDYSFWMLWVLLASIILVVGFLAGSYPAIVLSSFKPIQLYTHNTFSSKGSSLRKILVVVQFTLTIALLLGTVFIYKQVIYMKNAPLGFLKENKLVMEFPEGKVTLNNFESIKEQFEQNNNIIASTISSSVPGRWCYRWRLWPAGEEKENAQSINCFEADDDFLEIYGIKVIAGEQLKISAIESGRSILTNEETVKAFKWNTNEVALTKAINRPTERVIGVIKNYHFQGLQNKIEPMIIFSTWEDCRYITLQLSNNENISDVIAFCRDKYLELFPGAVFNYFFLDEDFVKQYQPEERIARLFMILTLIGLVIATIGLFGLSSFLCQQKNKEIGIRKVHGARIWDVFTMLTKSFTGWILISFVMAVPMAYYSINSWLQNFAYRIEISWWIILLTGLFSWLVAMLTVSYQTYSAAIKNPVESLKYE
jgi:putative ABC transport system permease protein